MTRRWSSHHARSESNYLPVVPPVSREANGEKTRGEMAADAKASADQQPVRFKCALCDWTLEAPAAEGREQAKAHRLEQHPEARQTKRPRRISTRVYKGNDDDWAAGEARAALRRAQIEAREAMAG